MTWEFMRKALAENPSDVLEKELRRMLVILSPSEYDTWLDRDMDDPDCALQSLFQPFPTEMQSVSALVNSLRHEGED